MVLVGKVLGIVDQQIGTLEECGMVGVGRTRCEVTALGKGGVMRFVIGGIDHDDTVVLEPEPEAERRVIEVLRTHLEVTDPELTLDQIVIVDGRTHLLGRHREVRVLHLSGERFADRIP